MRIPQDTPTRRLLGELGHDVTRADSPVHAMELINSDHTDLLVVDITNVPIENCSSPCATWRNRNGRTRWRSSRIRSMGTCANGDEVAPSHVHVFLKPLHMHGLLSVLRQMEKQHA